MKTVFRLLENTVEVKACDFDAFDWELMTSPGRWEDVDDFAEFGEKWADVLQYLRPDFTLSELVNCGILADWRADALNSALLGPQAFEGDPAILAEFSAENFILPDEAAREALEDWAETSGRGGLQAFSTPAGTRATGRVAWIDSIRVDDDGEEIPGHGPRVREMRVSGANDWK